MTTDPLRRFSDLLGGVLEGSEELFVATDLLHTFIETVSVPVFVKDTDSVHVGCNNAFADLLGFTVREVVGRTDGDLGWHALDREGGVDWDRRVLSSGIESLATTEPYRIPDGSIRWVETDRYPLLGADGHVIGMIGSLRDVTARVEAERELQLLVGSLDQQVDEQTAELARKNEALRKEMNERERLQVEEREQREKLEVLRDIASALSTTLDIDVVLNEIVTGIQRLLFADLIAVVLVEGDHLTVRRLDISKGYEAAKDAFAGRLEEWLRSESGPGVENGATALIPNDRCFGSSRSAIAAVMVVGGQRVGYLVVESRAKHLASDFSRGRLGAIAGQAAATLSTLQLSADAADQAALHERERLAQDLHDTVIQAVSTVSLLSDAARSMVDADDPVAPLIERMHAAALDSQAEMRSLLLEMRDDQLRAMSLRQLMELAIAVFSARSNVEVIADLQHVELDEETSIALYRIVQEALSNILRHAQASSVTVSLSADPIRIHLRDDGVGFDPSEERPGHLGLQIMGERASSVGASLTVTSSPLGGTDVGVELRSARGDVELRSPDGSAGESIEELGGRPSSEEGSAATSPAPRSDQKPHVLAAWLLLLLLTAGGSLSLIALRASVSDAMALDRAAVEQAQLLAVRSNIVRPHLSELAGLLLEPFGLADRESIDDLEAERLEVVEQARGDLVKLAENSAEVGAEAQYLVGILERWGEEDDLGPLPDLLYGRAEEMQFDRSPPPADPPTRLTGLSELIWADQIAQFITVESLIVRFATLEQPPASTAEANEYLGESLGFVLEEGGWLGPDPSAPMTGGYMPVDASIAALPTIYQQMNELIADSSLWDEDQWIRTLAEDPERSSPNSIQALVIDTSQVVFELRQVIDDQLARFISEHESDLENGEDARGLYTGGLVAGLALGAVAAIRLIVLAVRRGRQLSIAARTDPLTGAGNRKVLEHDTTRFLADLDLDHHVVVTIDMDRFKLVNDLHGHGFGDRILQITADGLRELVEPSSFAGSTIVRLGGDEFLLSLHDDSPIDVATVRAALDRLRERIVSAEDGSIVHPQFSYGVVEASGSPDLTDLMKASDLAAYEEKALRRRDQLAMESAAGSETISSERY